MMVLVKILSLLHHANESNDCIIHTNALSSVFVRGRVKISPHIHEKIQCLKLVFKPFDTKKIESGQ